MSNPKRPGTLAPQPSSAQELRVFLDRATALRVGDNARLLFALDATASRQPSWDRACELQTRMFEATREIAGLSIQLCYYRGVGEFRALPWSTDSASLRHQMQAVSCLGGYTQIEKVLRHGLQQHKLSTVQAIVFIGDAVEEDSKALYQLAGELGIHRLPIFMFQEGQQAETAAVYGKIAQLSGGFHCQFDERSEAQLRELLTAVAVYASGGVDAVKRLPRSSALVQQLIEHL